MFPRSKCWFWDGRFLCLCAHVSVIQYINPIRLGRTSVFTRFFAKKKCLCVYNKGKEKYKTKTHTVSFSSHTKTSVWSFPFIATKRDWEIKNGERTTLDPPTPSRTHKRTLHVCTAVSEPSQSHRFTGCRVKEYVIWKHTCSDLHSRLSFTLKENRERQKNEGFMRLKSSICDVFLSELYVCPPAEI